MGWCVDISPTRQLESPVPELFSVSQQGSREGTVRGGLVRGDHPVVVNLPSWVLAPGRKASVEKKSELGSQARKGKFIRGKREGDWPLRRTSVLPF